jgi:colanic acid/amylovoran biosynthesis glycosyltransferase
MIYLIRALLLTFIFFCAHSMESRPLHILFVVEYFPAQSQIFILNLMTGLIDEGHKISIFSYKKNDFPQQHSNVAKYSLMDSVIYEQWPATLPDCDIVFCQSATLGKRMLETESLAKWLKKRKLVISLRGADITKNEVKNNPRIYEKLFKESDLFLPVCHYFKLIATQLGCDPHKIVVHHSAINCSQFFFKERQQKKNETVQLISVCRLVAKKGLNFALEALEKVVKKHKNVQFTIVGRGPLKHYLKKLTKKLKLKNQVTFFGWGTHEQIVRVLNTSHIFLLPSITTEYGDEEGIANALKEAMAMGLIVVATYHAGTPELIVDGESGFMVPEKNSTALANKINYIIEHPETWKSIGVAARNTIEQDFEIKQSIKDLENIFNRLLKS